MKKGIIGVSTILSCVLLYFYMGNNMNKKTILKVGFPVYWENLIPSLQHTGYADTLMANQFEALVTSGRGGVTQPLAAKSWTISNDFKTFTFKIDIDKKFSNGQNLTASDFKRSWEYGLKLDPKSSNSSLQDIMYRVVGYKEFKSTGTLEGVQVIDKETLQIEFKEPFRMALNYLAGSRMSAFIRDGDFHLGTGPYILKNENKTLFLNRNKYSKEEAGFAEIEIVVVPPSEAQAALKSGLIDIYALAEFANIHECFEESKLIGCYSGSEARHQSLMINGMNDRFFKNRKHRIAIQALIHKKLTNAILPSYHKFNLNLDSQIYLPLQTGRLDDQIAENIISAGNEYISDFISATQTNPLFIITSEDTNWIQELLKAEGVKFTKNSGHISTQERIKIYYKTFDADIIVMAFSVASGDPDGIYHALGKNGSISSPIQYRKSVADLLEDGRHIIDLKKADTHYKKISEESLREVPFVHLGFTKTIVAFRKDRIKVRNKYKNRDEAKLSIYESI